jgi:hypothetical protein
VFSGKGQDLNMKIEILLIVILGGTAFAFYRFNYKLRKQLFAQIGDLYKQSSGLVHSNSTEKIPSELKKALYPKLENLTDIAGKLEIALNGIPPLHNMQELVFNCRPLIDKSAMEIEEIHKLWSRFVEYKKNLAGLVEELNQLEGRIKGKTMSLIGQNEENRDVLEEKITDVMAQIDEQRDNLIRLKKTAFERFLPYVGTPEIKKELLRNCNILMKELQLFKNDIKIYITELKRNSSYYLSLVDSTKIGIKKHAGSCVATFSTFSKAKKGDPYRYEIVVGGKYVNSEQTLSLNIVKDKEVFTIQKVLNKREFEEIFKSIGWNKKFEELDEKGVPYQLIELDLDILVCEKNAQEFRTKYHLDAFSNIPVYDMISLNSRFGDNERYNKPAPVDEKPEDNEDSGDSVNSADNEDSADSNTEMVINNKAEGVQIPSIEPKLYNAPIR